MSVQPATYNSIDAALGLTEAPERLRAMSYEEHLSQRRYIFCTDAYHPDNPEALDQFWIGFDRKVGFTTLYRGRIRAITNFIYKDQDLSDETLMDVGSGERPLCEIVKHAKHVAEELELAYAHQGFVNLENLAGLPVESVRLFQVIILADFDPEVDSTIKLIQILRLAHQRLRARKTEIDIEADRINKIDLFDRFLVAATAMLGGPRAGAIGALAFQRQYLNDTFAEQKRAERTGFGKWHYDVRDLRYFKLIEEEAPEEPKPNQGPKPTSFQNGGFDPNAFAGIIDALVEQKLRGVERGRVAMERAGEAAINNDIAAGSDSLLVDEDVDVVDQKTDPTLGEPRGKRRKLFGREPDE